MGVLSVFKGPKWCPGIVALKLFAFGIHGLPLPGELGLRQMPAQTAPFYDMGGIGEFYGDMALRCGVGFCWGQGALRDASGNEQLDMFESWFAHDVGWVGLLAVGWIAAGLVGSFQANPHARATLPRYIGASPGVG